MTFKPMLADSQDRLPWGLSDTWAMEPKYDGNRLLWTNVGGRVKCLSRIGTDRTNDVDWLYFDLAANTILDGELIVPFGTSSDVSKLSARDQLVYVVFDAPQLGGMNIRRFPWWQRRQALEQLASRLRGPRVMLAPVLKPNKILADELIARGHEGVILKRKSAWYQEHRSKDWLKYKHELEIDAVIVDALSDPTPGSEGAREGWTVLSYGFASSTGDFIRYGSVGHSAPMEHQLKHVGKVAVIKCNGVYIGGKLRHPRISYFRDDKLATECTIPPATIGAKS